MMVDPFSRLVLGVLLLGSLACASSGRDLVERHARRNAELDRLGQQAGIPDTWQTHYLKDALPHVALAADDR